MNSVWWRMLLGLSLGLLIGNVVSAADVIYIYDDAGRLKAVIDNSATNGVAQYIYDSVGNLLSVARQSTVYSPA